MVKKATMKQKQGHHVKEHKKLYQKQVSKVTLHFVWGHLTRKQTVHCIGTKYDQFDFTLNEQSNPFPIVHNQSMFP